MEISVRFSNIFNVFSNCVGIVLGKVSSALRDIHLFFEKYKRGTDSLSYFCELFLWKGTGSGTAQVCHMREKKTIQVQTVKDESPGKPRQYKYGVERPGGGPFIQSS